ncbi:hypothetical protein TSMEX_010327 [Taenia solium]|eukprot:TsM_000644700 transcript=TsM_000644700 gene=TsM_000644700
MDGRNRPTGCQFQTNKSAAKTIAGPNSKKTGEPTATPPEVTSCGGRQPPRPTDRSPSPPTELDN